MIEALKARFTASTNNLDSTLSKVEKEITSSAKDGFLSASFNCESDNVYIPQGLYPEIKRILEEKGFKVEKDFYKITISW